jgi:hypothetical protein
MFWQFVTNNDVQHAVAAWLKALDTNFFFVSKDALVSQ